MSESRHHAHIEHDIMSRGIKVALTERISGGMLSALWGPRSQWRTEGDDFGVKAPPDAPDASPWLRLTDGEARALYEALAEHFGHTLHADTAALRKDLDREARRVDQFITYHLRGE